MLPSPPYPHPFAPSTTTSPLSTAARKSDKSPAADSLAHDSRKSANPQSRRLQNIPEKKDDRKHKQISAGCGHQLRLDSANLSQLLFQITLDAVAPDVPSQTNPAISIYIQLQLLSVQTFPRQHLSLFSVLLLSGKLVF